MNLPIFKIRPSACGHIMAASGITDKQIETIAELEAKPKRTDKQDGELKRLIFKRDNPELPEGAKTYCKDWLKSKLYNRQKEITTKYMEKGLVVEDNSIDFIADILGYGMLIKNTRMFDNDYCSGTPDIVFSDVVIDAKNSWDWSTFPYFETVIPEKNYEWQLQCYMWLTDKQKAKLIYVLSDTPMHLIEREATYYCRNNNIDMEQEIADAFIAKMTYPDIPDRYKIKVFDIARDEVAIKAIQDRVLLCRKYIETLTKQL